MDRFIGLVCGGAAFAIMVAAPVNAETLPIEGVYPAGNDQLSALNTIAMGPFGGSEGQSLAIELEQKLRDVRVRGASYFSIVPFRSKGGADGSLSGTASSRMENRTEIVEGRACAYEDNNGRCKQWRQVKVACERRIVTLNYTLSVEGRRRERVFGITKTAVDSTLICPDSGEVPAVDVVVGRLVSRVATELRLQFAPLETREDIRVKEGTEGLQNNAKKKFKEGIKATKKNVTSACEIWAEVDQLVPNHAPTLFNLGLCAESRRDYNAAEGYYQRVADLNRSERYAVEAIERLNRRRHAERQLATQASRRVRR